MPVPRGPQPVVILSTTAFLTAALFMAILGYVIYTAAHRGAQTDIAPPFCCPQEAESMARNVNASADPCTNFFAYICKNRTHGASVFAELRLDAERVIMTGAKSEGAVGGKAGEFLTAFFKSCLDVVSHRELFLSDLGSGLIETMHELVSKPDTKNAMAYILRMSLQYQLSSWIHAFPYDSDQITLEVDLGCSFERFSLEALEALGAALKEKMNVTVPRAEAVGIRKTLCHRFPSVEKSNSSIYSLDDRFDKDVWSVEELKAGLDMFVYPISSASVKVASAVKAIHDIFAAPSGDGLKAACLMWKTVENAMAQFDVTYDRSTKLVFSKCQENILQMSELLDLFFEELYADAENKAKATAVFAAVKDTVYGDCRKSNLFEPEDVGRLENFFTNMSLLFTTEGTEFATPVPKPDRHFTANLLQGRAHIYAYRTKAFGVRGEVVYDDDEEYRRYYKDYNLIYFVPHLYKYAVPGQSFRSDLLNMAVLGRMMAEHLWYIVLNEVDWGSKTKDNIIHLVRCFDPIYTISETDDVDLSEVSLAAADVLGLASTLKAFHRSDWYNVKHAWSLWYWSHAMFFYTFSTFQRCPTRWSVVEENRMNTVLKQVKDFARTFSCPYGSPTGNGSRCIPSGIATE